VSWLTTAIASTVAFLVTWVPARREDFSDSGLRLAVAAAGAPSDARIASDTADSRVIRLKAPAQYEVSVENPGANPARARLWLLRGTEATQIWSGVVAAGARQRALPYRAVASTDVVLLQWGNAVASDAGGVAMEGPLSKIYYFVSDSAVRRESWASAPAGAPSREPVPELEQAFDRAAEARKESFEALLQARSSSRVLVGVPNFRALRIALAQMHEPGTAMLMYAPSGDSLETWMITADGELLRHVGGSVSAAVTAMQTLRGALGVDALQASRSPQQRGVQAAAPAAARNVSLNRAARAAATLLYPAPMHAALRRAKHLVIVPAFDLGAMPFALLPHPAGGETVEHATVVVAPSICDVMQVGHRVSYAELALQPLIIGDPLYPTTGSWIFPQLPGAASEAASVARALGASWHSGAEASRALVRSRVQEASLIYVATHGIASASNAMDGSFLQLADDANGGRWTAREIQSRPLRARLAVLSACQTGLGMAHDGGIIGVARSFLNVGASQVVMSLWNVDDAATERLMLGLMESLKEYPPPEALRRAMLAERGRRGSRPALWASFTVLGATW